MHPGWKIAGITRYLQSFKGWFSGFIRWFVCASMLLLTLLEWKGERVSWDFLCAVLSSCGACAETKFHKKCPITSQLPTTFQHHNWRMGLNFHLPFRGSRFGWNQVWSVWDWRVRKEGCSHFLSTVSLFRPTRNTALKYSKQLNQTCRWCPINWPGGVTYMCHEGQTSGSNAPKSLKTSADKIRAWCREK